MQNATVRCRGEESIASLPQFRSHMTHTISQTLRNLHVESCVDSMTLRCDFVVHNSIPSGANSWFTIPYPQVQIRGSQFHTLRCKFVVHNSIPSGGNSWFTIPYPQVQIRGSQFHTLRCEFVVHNSIPSGGNSWFTIPYPQVGIRGSQFHTLRCKFVVHNSMAAKKKNQQNDFDFLFAFP